MNPHAELILITDELARRKARRKLFNYFPDTGSLRRELYVKHLSFFQAGASYRERCFMAGNRCGKSETGGCEVTYHLTGLYPDWWEGKRFDRPTDGWAAGDTSQTVRDILQGKLCGTPGVPGDQGTGLIPGDLIINATKKRGQPDAFETVFVRHISGGVSTLTFKSYDQGRESFQGTSKDFVWLDEEPNMHIYTECLLRTMTTGGMVLLTFTPLSGMSEVVLSFMPGGKMPQDMANKFIVMATWDDAPHLSQAVKDELWSSLPPHQRKARSQGVPSLGSGAIYPVEEDFITVKDFIIPQHWPRSFAMDVGWNWTAAVWGAVDRESDTSYLYACYKRSQAEPPIHAAAIKSRGDWIPGVIDPASRGSSQNNGEKLIQLYRDCGLSLIPADNAIEAGLYDVWTGLSTGKLKVFKSMALWFDEFRLYRRDEKGKIVKENDHLQDCTRYFYRSGRTAATTKPVVLEPGTIIGDYHKKSAMCS